MSSSSSTCIAKPHVPGCLCEKCHYEMVSDSPSPYDKGVAEHLGAMFYGGVPILTGDALKAAKRSLVAVPSSSVGRVNNFKKHVGKGKGKGKTGINQSISKSYFQNGGRPGILKSIGIPAITTMLNFDTTFITTSTTVPTYGALFFRLSYFDNYAQYTSLFDQYMFHEVEVWIENTKTSAVVTQSKYVTCLDHDDANTPSSYNQVADRVSSLQTDNLCAHYHRFVPHMAIAAYSGTFVSFTNEPPTWIDSASPDVQHYGLKGASVATPDSVMTYNLFCRARLSFRATGI